MNDYKELIEQLRSAVYRGDAPMMHGFCVIIDKPLVKQATDAIKQLVRERDAAMHDLDMAVCGQESYPCGYCANYGIKPIDVEDVCETCTDCDKWEWRGVQNEID